MKWDKNPSFYSSLSLSLSKKLYLLPVKYNVLYLILHA